MCVFDYNNPIVITFSPAGYLLQEDDLDRGKNAWSYSFLKENRINVLSLNCVKSKHWFLENGLEEKLTELAKEIMIFPERIGYGVSMGAFALSNYHSVFNINKMLLITPTKPPFEIEFEFEFAKDFTGDILLIYDPFFPKDRNFALSYSSNTTHFYCYGVGHRVVETLSEIGLLKKVVLSFISGIEIYSWYYKSLKGRRGIERYYSFLLRNPTGKNSKNRNRIIRKKYILFIINNPGLLMTKWKVKLMKSARRINIKLRGNYD